MENDLLQNIFYYCFSAEITGYEFLWWWKNKNELNQKEIQE